MPDTGAKSVFGAMIANDAAESLGGEPAEDGLAETANDATLVEKPLDETNAMRTFEADHRGPDHHDVFARGLALALAAAIIVDRIRLVGFGIATLAAGKDAIGAEVNESCARPVAHLRQTMRKMRIHLPQLCIFVVALF